MNPLSFAVITLAVWLIAAPGAIAQPEKIDTLALSRIKAEGLGNSRVMDLLATLCDTYSPRLTWSPEYRRGAEWVSATLRGWGISTTVDRWAPLGKGWTLKEFSAMVTQPVSYPVIAYPSAWSPGIREKEAGVVHFRARTEAEYESYRGKLKGKYVVLGEPLTVRAHFEPQAVRLADSVLLRMANAEAQTGGRRGPRRFPRLDRITPQTIDSAIAAMRQINPDTDTLALRERLEEMMAAPRRLEFLRKEGALAVITPGRGDGGTMIVQAASVPQSPDAPRDRRVGPYDASAPEFLPQVVFAAEHFNRIVRMLHAGEKVTLAMKLEVEVSKPDSGFNVIGEIPGTDLKDEVVMIGGHFDTWHAGTGATDNNTGTAACMEAMRILQAVVKAGAVKPRRTIRIGLWGGEEQGLIGSREYVAQTYARREGGGSPFGGGGGDIQKTTLFDKFSVYFNHDNGSGRFRGIYLQGNEAARPIFRAWLSAFGDPAAQTVTAQNTGGTDHQSFDGVGLPGFQFIQDPLEYDTRTHHYNMDTFERIQEADMKQAATIMAFFAYQAATRDGRIPRKAVQGLQR
jgi:hypothetical protein